MIPAALAAISVLVIGMALQPRPASRRFDATQAVVAVRAHGPRPTGNGPTDLFRRNQSVDAGELAVWCDSLARSLRGGATLHHAVRTVAPPASVSGMLAPALLALERGASVSSAVSDLEVSSPHLDLVLVVLKACADNGGTAAEPIDRAASALRQRAALAGERRTQSAQARMSAIVMTLLPGAMLLTLLVTSAAVRATVVSSVGIIVVASGASLNLAGWWWMRRLINGTR